MRLNLSKILLVCFSTIILLSLFNNNAYTVYSQTSAYTPELKLTENNDDLGTYLRMIDQTDQSCNYYQLNQVDRAQGVTVEARSRLYEDIEGVHGPMAFYIADGTDWFIISIGDSFVEIEHDNLEYFRWTNNDVFNGSDFHTYRITCQQGNLSVYVDNITLGGPWTTQRAAVTDQIENEIRFGVLWSRTYKAIIDWDYVRVKYNSTVIPPTIPEWNNQLEMDVYPESNGWINDVNPENSVELHYNDNTTPTYLRMYDSSENRMNFHTQNIVNRTTGVTIEARSRLYEDIEGVHGPMAFYIADGTEWFIISIGNSFVEIEHDNLEYFRWTNNSVFTGSEFHTYRITCQQGNLSVYVDNITLGGPWTTHRTAVTDQVRNEIRFGVLWSRSYKAIIDWDYLYIKYDNSLAPPINPEWDIQLEMDQSPSQFGWISEIGKENYIDLPYGDSDEDQPILIDFNSSLSIFEYESVDILWNCNDDHPAGYILYIDSIELESNYWNGSIIVKTMKNLIPGIYNCTILFYDEFGNSVSTSTLISVNVTLSTTSSTITSTTTTSTTSTTSSQVITSITPGFSHIMLIIPIVLFWIRKKNLN